DYELVIAEGPGDGESSIYIRPHAAIQRFIPSKEQKEYCEPNLSSIQIPDIMGLASFIPQIFDIDEIQIKQPLFKKKGMKKEAYRSEIARILKCIPGEMRINEHRISSFLAHKMV